MSVYVDNARISYRGMKMSHMVADTKEELLVMVDKIGVQRKWIQGARGLFCEHFDICESKRRLAINKGAIELSTRELAQKAKDIADMLT
jgi:hypothetical protein